MSVSGVERFENDKTDLCQIFFQGLGENTSLQPALKNTAGGLLRLNVSPMI